MFQVYSRQFPHTDMQSRFKWQKAKITICDAVLLLKTYDSYVNMHINKQVFLPLHEQLTLKQLFCSDYVTDLCFFPCISFLLLPILALISMTYLWLRAG